MGIRAHAVLSSATTYWADTAYTVEQFVAHVGPDESNLLTNECEIELYQVYDLDNEDEVEMSLEYVEKKFPSTIELEMEWSSLNWHRVEYHWFQMESGDPKRTRMDVSFMKVLWEGMKFPERRVYNTEQIERLARSSAVLSHFRYIRLQNDRRDTKHSNATSRCQSLVVY